MKDQSLFFAGDEHEILLPSGKIVTIRETNGEDDGILSKIKNAKDNTHIYNFLANIIIKDHDTNDKVMASDIMDWLINDKYYLLFKQRIINLGSEFKMRHVCENETCKKQSDYTENLLEIDGDLGSKDYKPGPNQIAPYEFGKAREVEFTSSRKNKFKFDCLTGNLEKKDLDIPNGDKDVNNGLIARNVQVFENGTWIRLFNWGKFPSKEMVELRTFVYQKDKPFEPLVSFICDKCNTPYQVSLFYIPAFFFPEE